MSATSSPLSSEHSSVENRTTTTSMVHSPFEETIGNEDIVMDETILPESVAPSQNQSIPKTSSFATDANSDASSFFPNNNTEVTVNLLLVSAEEDLTRKKNHYLITLGHYLSYAKVNPTSEHAKNAYNIYKKAENLCKAADDTYKMLKAVNSPPTMPDDKKSMLVPSNLPFLQLITDTYIEKTGRDVFDSVYDFCQEFTTVLEAHSLSLDFSWERLLPMCLNKEERSWFEDKLKNKAYNWKEAEGLLLDHYDTPFRKFLNMGRVWCMKQACLEDGVQLVLCFWWNLLPEVREACLIPLSANYGSSMPSNIEDIISLVCATTSDSASWLVNPSENKGTSAWRSYAAKNAANGLKGGKAKGKSQQDVGKRGSPCGGVKKSMNSWSFKKALKSNLCFACKAPWVKGHSCPGRENDSPKVSRMAVRSGTSAAGDHFVGDGSSFTTAEHPNCG